MKHIFRTVQVAKGQWGAAAIALGVNLQACKGGEYTKPALLPAAGENFPPPPAE